MAIFAAFRIAASFFFGCALVAPVPAFSHDGHHSDAARPVAAPELGTGAAIDRQGRLWVVTREVDAGTNGQFAVLRMSSDMGKSWNAPRRIQKIPEPVGARGEARPHIAFGLKDEIFISYTMTVARPHIGDIRFVRSLDGGQTFSEPVTVHKDRSRVTHSFESMVVDAAGRIFIAWIDGRDSDAAKKRQARYAGSAVYYAVSHDGGATFEGDYKVADHACECCRIGLAVDNRHQPVAMWRHVFAPNIRDHAISRLGADGIATPAVRVTHDDWRVDACPHHGPSVAYAADGTRHQVWFNGNDSGGGAYYASAGADGRLATPSALGSPQAAHADIAVSGRRIAIAWKQIDDSGKATAILTRVSPDGGATWKEWELARTTGASDKPYLLTHANGVALIWHTLHEGLRVIAIDPQAAPARTRTGK